MACGACIYKFANDRGVFVKTVAIIAPHPDDETLGCGGTILKHKELGDKVSWIIVTALSAQGSFSKEQISKRDSEIKEVAERYGFDQIICLNFQTTSLDTVPMSKIIGEVGAALNAIKPSTVYVPFSEDVHSDHRIVFDVMNSCSKHFRYPFLREILCYETISETEYNLNPSSGGFRPNRFVDISKFLDMKISIMSIYESEIGTFPFPRSAQNMAALANYRGSMIGVVAAESFMVLKEIVL